MRLPQNFITDAILKAIRSLPSYPKLEVLDLSCGRGEIASALARDGCMVRGTHYRSDDYKLTEQTTPLLTEGLAIDNNIDLLKPLPYETASRDLVILSEVVEHLPDYIPVLREAARILRPGGHLVLSTPNLARLHSRWHFFWTGTHKLVRRRVGWDLSANDLYAYHVNPVDFPLFHTVLHQSGLAVTELRFTRFKVRHAPLLLLYPLFWLTTRLETRPRLANEQYDLGENDLFRWMMKPAMLASEQLLVIARREQTE